MSVTQTLRDFYPSIFFPPILVFVLLSTFLATIVCAQDIPEYIYSRQDPSKIITAVPCGECHQSEYRIWERSKHARGFKDLHRKESAEKITAKMGFKLIKRESLCLQCHYTPIVKNSKLRAVSGVSCESCHGAARDWINIHNNFGGKEFNFQTETPQHKIDRIANSKKAGMLRPSELYDVVANCFQCHTVPNEKLVNLGGHTSGSNFELVKWQEEIRHNFLQSFLMGDGTKNEEKPQNHKRVMYVVGRSLDLEYSLRGAAKATTKGVYVKAMIRRTRNAISELKAINERKNLTEIDDMLVAVKETDIKINNKISLLLAADKISNAAKQVIKKYDGSQLAGLDKLILGIDESPEPTNENNKQVVDNSSAVPNRQIPSSSKPKQRVSQSQVGQFVKSPSGRFWPRSKRKTLGPSCSCHEHDEQNKWWVDDKHYASADPFFEGNPQNKRIAQLYGIKPSEMTKGNAICMDCHGTVVTGKERREVNDGVSCESCHGAASDYKEKHEKGGYDVGRKLGMVFLEDVSVRAKTCASCHYVTDQRLISVGHPTGKDFEIVTRNKAIQHWDAPILNSASLKSAYAKVIKDRGPIPAVVSLNKSSPLTESFQSSSLEDTEQALKPPKFVALSGRPAQGPLISGSINLPSFPDVTDSTTVEDILLLIKQRLDLMYKKVR